MNKLKSKMNTNEIVPFKATHPGSLIKDELKARGIKQSDFARDIGMSLTVLNELINGKRSVTAEISLILEKALDISADYWLRFQTNYDLDCARIKDKNIKKTKDIEIWKLIKEYVPVNQLIKMDLLTKNLSKNIEIIWDIYKVNTIDELIGSYSKYLNSSHYMKSDKLKSDPKNIFAKSYLTKWQAQNKKVL